MNDSNIEFDNFMGAEGILYFSADLIKIDKNLKFREF